MSPDNFQKCLDDVQATILISHRRQADQFADNLGSSEDLCDSTSQENSDESVVRQNSPLISCTLTKFYGLEHSEETKGSLRIQPTRANAIEEAEIKDFNLGQIASKVSLCDEKFSEDIGNFLVRKSDEDSFSDLT